MVISTEDSVWASWLLGLTMGMACPSLPLLSELELELAIMPLANPKRLQVLIDHDALMNFVLSLPITAKNSV